MIDNTLWDGAEADPEHQDTATQAIRAFNRHVQQDQRVALSLVPVGAKEKARGEAGFRMLLDLPGCWVGGAEGDRTLDLRIANATLSQLSYRPTHDLEALSYNSRSSLTRPARPKIMSRISIVLPVLNEEAQVARCLQDLQPQRGADCELIVVDGGSNDRTVPLAEPLADQVITGPKGRAMQMNAGARRASGEILWFLHADSTPPENATERIRAALANPNHHWGRFDVRLSGRHPLLRVVETLMNFRSGLTGIATGDQGIFVRREAFERVDGFPAIALMEDIAFSRRLRRHGWPIRLRQRLRTSSRRWEQDGILRTILLMWWLRLAYFFGADPARLARIYYRS